MLAQKAQWCFGLLHRHGLGGQLARGSLSSFIVKLSSTALGFALTMVLARVLGVEGLGVYAYVYSFLSLLAVPAQLGLTTLVVRETAYARTRSNWALLKGVWRWAGTFVAIFSLALCLLSAAVVYFSADRFTGEQLKTFWWGVLLVPVIALGNVRGAALRGLRRVLLGTLPEHVLRPALFIASLLATSLVVPDERLSPSAAMLLHVVSGAGAFLIGGFFLWRARPTSLSGIAPTYESRSWLRSLIPLGLVAALQASNKYLDILILGYLGTAADVGIYRIAVQGAMLVAFGSQAISIVVSPYIAHIYAQGDRNKLQAVVTATARAVLCTALPVVAVFVIFGAELLALFFGEEFSQGGTALAILATGRFIAAAMGPSAALLSMSRHEGQAAKAGAIAAVCGLALNFLLIPRFGVNGAATATAVGFIGWHIAMRSYALRSVGVDTLPFRLWKARSS